MTTNVDNVKIVLVIKNVKVKHAERLLKYFNNLKKEDP